jgi:hypothetical protein
MMAIESVTEATWSTSNALRPMLSFLQGKARERKFKLFACACCRRIDHLLADERSHHAIEVVEQFHDGKVTRQKYNLAERAANDAYSELAREVAADELTPDRTISRSIMPLTHMFAAQTVVACFKGTYFAVTQGCCGALRGRGTVDVKLEDSLALGESIEAAERAAQANLLRDIFGNPFRPATLDPSWLTSTVLALARQMYDTRDFSAMPILADALQDAGCDNEEILNHCRGESVHVRGCWLVDSLTDRQ